MNRRFQFSLRMLLFALTVASLWLGWKVDRAQRRGQAIDAIIKLGCSAGYVNGEEVVLALSRDERCDHLWLDLKSTPVVINLMEEDAWSHDCVKPAIATQLSRISGINEVCLPKVHIDWRLGKINGFLSQQRRRSVELMLPNSTIHEPTVYRDRPCTAPSLPSKPCCG